jgi:hypothetical protein
MMFDAEKSPNDKHYSAAEFAEAFKSSARYQKITSEQASPLKCNWKRSQLDSIQENDEENAQHTNDHANRLLPEYTKREYMNSFWTSTMLNVKRHVSIK